jgi:preprotein translocase subunit SecE
MTAPISFFQQTFEELKKVTWPTRNNVIRLTIIVLFISVAVGLYIGAIDFVLTKITETLIK